MIDNDRISIALPGPEPEDESLDFDMFIEQLRRLRDVLKATDRFVSEDGQPCTDFLVVDLHHSSPFVADVQAVTIEGRPDVRRRLLRLVGSAVQDIQEKGQSPRGFDTSLLDTYEALVSPFAKSLPRPILSVAGSDIALSPALATNIETIKGPPIYSRGTVRGMLEAINIHASRNEFRIYPVVGPKSLVCTFPKDLLEKAIRGIGQYVGVQGTLVYNRIDQYPLRVRADTIEVYADEGEPPTLSEFSGGAPEATGEKSSEEFIRGLRDEWD